MFIMRKGRSKRVFKFQIKTKYVKNKNRNEIAAYFCWLKSNENNNDEQKNGNNLECDRIHLFLTTHDWQTTENLFQRIETIVQIYAKWCIVTPILCIRWQIFFWMISYILNMKKASHSYTYPSRKFITVVVICLCIFEFPMNFFFNLNNTRTEYNLLISILQSHMFPFSFIS